MKRIAIFIDNLSVGGIQKSIVNMLNNINLKEYEIDLYIFSEEKFYSIPEGVNVIRQRKPIKLLQFIPFELAKIIYNPIISKKNYDISIDFDSYQMHTAIGAIKCNSNKKAIWIHNDIPIKLKEETKYRILYFFFKKKYKYFDIYNAVSQGALDSFKTLIKNKDKYYNVIPNYIDTTEIKEKIKESVNLKLDNSKTNIVSVGRLCHQKGIDIMLSNIKELVKYRQDFHLYLIGDGPEKEKLNNLCKKYDIENYVTFLGNQKNPFKFLKKMDLFYLSSRYEGQGMVLLEAISVGLDVLIPKHLEKYCPYVSGTKNILKFLKEYKTKKTKKFNNLKSYNNDITEKLKIMFD